MLTTFAWSADNLFLGVNLSPSTTVAIGSDVYVTPMVAGTALPRTHRISVGAQKGSVVVARRQ